MLIRKSITKTRISQSILAMIFLGTLVHGQEVTIRADVTGDRVYDDVKVGKDYVLLVDKMSCCKRTKRLVVDKCDSLVDVTVDDYHRGIYGQEIAVVQSSENGLFTDVFAYTNNRIEQVAFRLPGRVVRDDQGLVFCHEQYSSDNITMTIPCAVEMKDLLLEKIPVTDEQDTSFVLDSASIRRLEYHVSPYSILVLCAASDHPDVIFVLQDANGDPIEVEHVDDQMTAIVHAGKSQDIALVIDYHGGQERAHAFCIARMYRKGG